MYTGTLIEDLFEAVERAEKAAAKSSTPSQTIEILVSALQGSQPYPEEELEAK